MAVKKCTKCGVEKPLSDFSPNGNGYLKARCKPCKSAEVCAAYLAKPIEARRQQMRRISAWVAKNKDKYREYARITRQRNPDLYRLRVQLRRRRFRVATPPWANAAVIKSIYQEAARVSRETGIQHEVDHIIPLRGDGVCGLHVENNLRVVPITVNRKKGNRA